MLPTTNYRVTIGNNEDEKWNSHLIWMLNSEEIKGMNVALMLLGANGIPIQNNMKIREQGMSKAYLSKDKLLERYTSTITSPLEYYRKWTPFDTRNSTSIRIVEIPTKGSNVIYFLDAPQYMVEVSHDLTDDFVTGLSYASSITGTHKDYIYGPFNSIMNIDYWLTRLRLFEQPKEILDIIFSHIPGTMYSVNKEFYKKSRSLIMNTNNIAPRKKEQLVTTILSTPLLLDNKLPEEIESLALTYIQKSDPKYLNNRTFVSKLSTIALCEAHVFRIGYNYVLLINPIYVQMLIDRGHPFDRDVYIYIRNHMEDMITYTNDPLYPGLVSSTKLLITNRIHIDYVEVGFGIGVLPKDIGMECFNSLDPEDQADGDLVSNIGWTSSYTYNLELFDEISNLIVEQDYIQMIRVIYSNSIGYGKRVGSYSKSFHDICQKIFSSSRICPTSSHIVMTDEHIPKVDGIRLGLLSNLKFAAYHSKLSNEA